MFGGKRPYALSEWITEGGCESSFLEKVAADVKLHVIGVRYDSTVNEVILKRIIKLGGNTAYSSQIGGLVRLFLLARTSKAQSID